MQDDVIDKATEEVKETTAYNEEVTKPTATDLGDQHGNGCSNGAADRGTNGAADVCSNGAAKTEVMNEKIRK